MIAVAPPPLVQAVADDDPRTEYSAWRDSGCDVSPSCLRCPLPVCKYDDPGYLTRQRIAARQSRARELRSKGMDVTAIAAALGVATRTIHRDVAVVRPLVQVLPPGGPMARWGRGKAWPGPRLLWSKEACMQALAGHIETSAGRLPIHRDYDRIKKGVDLPPSARLYEVFGGIARAWLTAGAPRSRVPLLKDEWQPDEDQVLLELAGSLPLQVIGKRLHRSWSACKRRLYDLGTNARNNQGTYSAHQLAAELGCPIDRVSVAIHDGRLPATKAPGIPNRWQIDPALISAELRSELARPNGRQYRSWTYDEITLALNMRWIGFSFDRIGGKLRRNPKALEYRCARALERRPLWKAVWYVVQEFGGRAAILDVVRVLQEREVMPVRPDSYGAVRKAGLGKPDRLIVSNGVVSIRRWTSARVRLSQRAARQEEKAA